MENLIKYLNMINIKIDKNTVTSLKEQNVEKIKIFFYDSGCSGTKVDISSDFEVDESLVEVILDYSFKIYLEKIDSSKFEDCNITKTITADHTGKEKIRYIFSSNKIKDRCGCGSSFSFDKKVPKFDLNKLKEIKNKFKK